MKQRYWLLSLLCLLLPAVVLAQSIQPPTIVSIDWSDNGDYLAITTRAALTIYDTAFNIVASKPFPSDITFEIPDISLSPDGTRILVGKEILDTFTLQTIISFQDVLFQTSLVQWSSDGELIALREDRNTSIHSTIDGSQLRYFDFDVWLDGGKYVWSPNQQYFVHIFRSNEIYLLDATTGAEVAQYQLIGENITDVIWNPDNTRLALVSYVEPPINTPDSGFPAKSHFSIILMNVADGSITRIIEGMPDIMLDIVWSPDGTQLAGRDYSRRLYIWDTNTGRSIDSYLLADYRVVLFQYSPYSGRLMIGYDPTQNAATDPDDSFAPISTFSKKMLNGVIEFVAPAASPEHLQTILTQCVADPALVTAGNDFIASGQYSEFNQWLQQLPTGTLPQVCADDLRLMTEAVLYTPEITPTPSTTPTIAGCDAAPNSSTELITVLAQATSTTTICLAPDTTYTLDTFQTDFFGKTGLPPIQANITIEGNGATIERATTATEFFRLFGVSSTGSLTLKNLTLRGGNIDVNAGAALVNVGGQVTLENVTIMDNTATNTSDSQGGGIYNYFGTVTITGSRFTNNTAVVGAGALFNWGGTVSVSNSCFMGNTAPDGFSLKQLDGTTNAANNWWGSADGPAGSGAGQGDGVNEGIVFDPFLTSAPIHCGGTPIETPTFTPTFTDTPTETPTFTPTFTETPTDTPTFTPTFTETPTTTPTATPAYAASVTRFDLLDPVTSAVLTSVTQNATVNLAEFNITSIRVRAITAPSTVGSVVFGLNANPQFSTDNDNPYRLSGTLGVGIHTLSATPHEQSGGAGNPGYPLTIQLTLINDPLLVTPSATPTQTPTITPTPTATPVPLVTNIQVVSGSAYALDTLAIDKNVYTDRIYLWTIVPTEFVGQVYLKGRNNDKNRSEVPFLTFTLNQPATIYLAYDSRMTPLPSWASDWTATGQTLTATDATGTLVRNVYQKTFAAGTVSLGGNNGTVNNAMYTVIIVPQ